MSELPTQTAELITAEDYFQNLESASLADAENVRRVVDLIKNKAEQDGIEVHILAVGGTVDPLKRTFPRKDIDLVVWSPQLAIEAYKPVLKFLKFKKFANFLKNAVSSLGWEITVTKPHIDRLDHRKDRDGSVAFFPPDGGAIEIHPTRKDILNSDFESFIKSRSGPAARVL